MSNLKTKLNQSEFDTIITKRLLASDFAQPALNDFAFYKEKAISQISTAVKAIRSATSQHDFSSAIVQANAFLDAAQDYEFIDLTDKAKWLDEIASAVRIQTIGESA